jgi:hypothetical protein
MPQCTRYREDERWQRGRAPPSVLSRPAAQVFIISGALTPPAMASRARLIAEDLHAVNGSQKLLQSAPLTALRNCCKARRERLSETAAKRAGNGSQKRPRATSVKYRVSNLQCARVMRIQGSKPHRRSAGGPQRASVPRVRTSRFRVLQLDHAFPD